MIKKLQQVLIVALGALVLVPLSHGRAFAESSTLEADVQDYLSISVTAPTTWASGDINTFLRNKVSLSITSNNAAGFTASMTTDTPNSALVNSAKSTATLPTLTTTTTRANFPVNHWGYSFDDTDTGSDTSTYGALSGIGGTPVTVLTYTQPGTSTKDFYLGAKVDATQASGTYLGTIVVNVVSGVAVTDNPTTSGTDNPTSSTPASSDQTVAANTTNGNVNTTSHHNNTSVAPTNTTQSSTNSAKNSYAAPAGVSDVTNAEISDDSQTTTAIAATATAAAVAGAVAFVFAHKAKASS